MKIHEIVEGTGLYFKGSECTKDCSGHKAGYDWSRKRAGKIATGNSQSFVNGTNIANKELVKKTPAQAAQPKQPGYLQRMLQKSTDLIKGTR